MEKKVMKIGMYSPYVPKHVGGGEKYFFDCARCLQSDHQVTIGITQKALLEAGYKELKSAALISKYETFLGNDISKVSFELAPLDHHLLATYLWTKQFDAFIYVTDGSVFISGARRNIMHIQFPLTLDKSGWWEQFKLARWQVINTNSDFTRKVVEKYWPVSVDMVHYPMVTMGKEELQPNSYQAKEKIILHVGRFFSHLHSKRQDVLVDLFKLMREQHPEEMNDWRLVMIGNVEDDEYARRVSSQARGLPVTIIHEATRAEVLDYYRRAKIYWHATGFNIDETREPQKVEHFGISTVEAMASGCVPVVINKGGQPEILGEALQFLLWDSPMMCLTTTLKVINDNKLGEKISQEVRQRASYFNQERFVQGLRAMLEG